MIRFYTLVLLNYKVIILHFVKLLQHSHCSYSEEWEVLLDFFLIQFGLCID